MGRDQRSQLQPLCALVFERSAFASVTPESSAKSVVPCLNASLAAEALAKEATLQLFNDSQILL